MGTSETVIEDIGMPAEEPDALDAPDAPDGTGCTGRGGCGGCGGKNTGGDRSTKGVQAKPWDIRRVNSLQSAQGADHEVQLIEVLPCILVVCYDTQFIFHFSLFN